ncbi:MAG: hypothetical protein OEZ01_13280 [Candidatus Heimdallarchaeota archaeon]|nr:hypothetical protein [Candidatus Heimdallarchaeota archaeon]MDH5646980.1 hypothetical protein [Candidatus Heimdallarchaeota archaeon]
MEHNFTIDTKLGMQFWGAWFARIIDEFGIGWKMNYPIFKE